MDDSTCSGTSRRHFLATVVPACALTCIGFRSALAQEASKSPAGEKEAQPAHSFDAEYPRKLTYRQFYRNRYRESIQLTQTHGDVYRAAKGAGCRRLSFSLETLGCR